MLVKFNLTGTHIIKGLLKVRLDLYPDVTSKTYAQQYVDHYAQELTQEELDNPALLALVPTHKELNPCLCHFITIDTTKSLPDLFAEVKAIFDTATLMVLDDALSKSDVQRVSQIMKGKVGTGKEVKGNLTKIVNDTNAKLASLQVEV